MQTFERPMLFVHGDTHIFHVNKPLLNNKTQRFFENVTPLRFLAIRNHIGCA